MMLMQFSKRVCYNHGGVIRRTLVDYSSETLLSPDNLLRAASKFEALPLIRMQTTPTRRKAAVLIPLCEVSDRVSLLFTLRTSSLRSHKGQVSFPGGMQDVMDKTLKATALRETREELGVLPSQVKLWGQGQPIVARGETSVVPVIGTIEKSVPLNELNVNASEVQMVFTVPIEELARPEKVRFTQFRSGFTTPCFFAGDMRIWGLTGIITHAFLRCFIPGNAYQPRIRFVSPVRTIAKGASE
ncbi:mitochondrial coenzyme A diphosphatase NUDT8 [Atheta coriaria]|uniref:mitochondrial coenzyme A diphosphatase NUDT8 n=1 Tax=Dalotia coriaria TaxID=877792 RepID=UPI0031F37765